MMTVKDLRALLDGDPAITDDLVVILAADPEGNRFRPLDETRDDVALGYSVGRYDPRDGDVLHDPGETKDAEERANWDWAQDPAHAAPCLVLWPGGR